MIEPAITYGSTVFYRFLHQEPVRMRDFPLSEGVPDPDRDPYDSNQAIPTLLVTRDRREFEEKFPNLEIVDVSWFSFLVYPLSGGFKPWSLISEAAGRRVLELEKMIEAKLGRWFGFRTMIVLQKNSDAKISTGGRLRRVRADGSSRAIPN